MKGSTGIQHTLEDSTAGGRRTSPGCRDKAGLVHSSPARGASIQGRSRHIPGNQGCQMLRWDFKSMGYCSPLQHPSKE